MLKQMFLAGAAAAMMATAGFAQSAQLNDQEIADIAYTAGKIDVDAGNLALSKTQNPAVKNFAQTMVRDHGAVNDQVMALLKKLKAQRQDNATSRSLVQAAGQETAKLSGLSGAAFDKAYVTNEVAFHAEVIGALQKTLIPNAKNAEVKKLLETGLPLFQAHLAHAQQLEKTL